MKNQLTKEVHEKHLTSLAIKEMKIKTTLRFHPTPIRVATKKINV
jgi:hypothetical protein